MKGEKHIALLQGYYKFLYLGGFLNQVIKDNDLSKYAVDLPLDTGNGTSFTLKGSTVAKSLADIYKHADKKNFFGYLAEISALKGIFGVMREILDGEPEVARFVKQRLGERFFAFDQVVRFCRNVLVHAVDPNITLLKEHFESQRLYLAEHRLSKVDFVFVYAQIIKERTGGKDYGVHICIDFSQLKPGMKFFDVVSLHDLYLLAELCFNLMEIAKRSLAVAK